MLLPKLFWRRRALSRSTGVAVGIDSACLSHVSSTQVSSTLGTRIASCMDISSRVLPTQSTRSRRFATTVCSGSLPEKWFHIHFSSVRPRQSPNPEGEDLFEQNASKTMQLFSGQDRLSSVCFVILSQMLAPVLFSINIYYSGKFQAMLSCHRMFWWRCCTLYP